ncbi:MAG: polysaccharide biosynthesis protein [Lachnospiraceae bacterium]
MEKKAKNRGQLNRLLLILFDILDIYLALLIALLTRYDFHYNRIPDYLLDYLRQYSVWIILAGILIFGACHLYRSLWQFASVREFIYVFIASASLLVVMIAGNAIRNIHIPLGIYPLFFLCEFMFTFLLRFTYRSLRYLQNVFEKNSVTHRVLIIGAGEAGSILIKEMKNSEMLRNTSIVGIIDDDVKKQGRTILGVKVVGGRDKIIEYAETRGVTDIYLAIPRASAKVRQEMIEICQKTDCNIMMLPGIYQMLNGEVKVSKLRRVQVEDLLGREPVDTHLEEVMQYIHNQTVLVTGGGGSIGSELCRQIACNCPKQLIIFDIYENNAYDIQQELIKKYPNLNLLVLIGSVRNEKRLDDIFNTYRPNLVYHAAAHKHVPLMEDSPNEAIKNNVFGTYNVAKMADKYGVARFVLISTDKAVNPTNVMGASKRMCEMIVQMFSRHSKTEFVAVRFGNVLGSNGSVIPLFYRQIAAGGPVTVTHPDIIRYFMTIPEAVSLVLQAGAKAKGGEFFVLDMGQPVKIMDLAKNMIRLSGYSLDDIPIEIVGLRPGEKLYEEMLMDEEGLEETENAMIHIGKPIIFDDDSFMQQLREIKEMADEESMVDDMRRKIHEIVGTYVIPKN